LLEQALWKETGVTPAAPWYIESGQGMGATLGIADDRRAYTLTDRATYLALSRRLALTTLVEGDRALFNVYSVMEVNPANGPRVSATGGKAFADFMVAPATRSRCCVFPGARSSCRWSMRVWGSRPSSSASSSRCCCGAAARSARGRSSTRQRRSCSPRP